MRFSDSGSLCLRRIIFGRAFIFALQRNFCGVQTQSLACMRAVGLQNAPAGAVWAEEVGPAALVAAGLSACLPPRRTLGSGPNPLRNLRMVQGLWPSPHEVCCLSGVPTDAISSTRAPHIPLQAATIGQFAFESYPHKSAPPLCPYSREPDILYCGVDFEYFNLEDKR